MPIRSRGGNVVLAVIGAVYAITALVVLGAVVREAFAVRQLIDAKLQILLVATAACGIWFVLVALENLGRTPRWLRRGTPPKALRTAPVHRTDAVAPR